MNFQKHHYLYWFIALAIIVGWRYIRSKRRRIVVPYLAMWLSGKHDPASISSLIRYIFRLLSFLSIALIILALALPFNWERHYHSLIVLDNSATMTTCEKGGNRWQQACALATGYAEPGDTILVTTPRPTQTTLAQLANMAPHIGEGEPEKTIRLALNLLTASQQLVVITDAAGPRWPGIIAAVQRECPEAVVHIVGKHQENLAVRLHVVSDFAPEKIGIIALVGNHGHKRQSNRLCWQWHHQDGSSDKVQRSDCELLPGKIFYHHFPISTAGDSGRLHCWLERPDAFSADDSAACRIEALKKARILLIGSKPRPYLFAALASFPNLVDLHNSGVANGKRLPPLHDYDLVIVDRSRWPAKLTAGNYLFWGTQLSISEASGRQIGPLSCWGTNSRHPVARHLDLALLKVIKAWPPPPGLPQENTIAYSANGPLIWEGHQQNSRYIYVAFGLEDSQLRWLPALPIFIRNVISWTLASKQNRWELQQYEGNSDIQPVSRLASARRRSFLARRHWDYQISLATLLGLLLLALPVMRLARRQFG